MKSNVGIYQSSNSSTSTLRPRNNRLISFVEDEDQDPATTATATSSPAQTSNTPSLVPPLFSSRAASPNGDRPVRTRSLNKGGGNGGGSQAHTRTTSQPIPSPSTSTDLWSAWSYASSFIVGDPATSASKGKARSQTKPPKWMKQDRGYNTPSVAPKWGLSSRDMSSAPPGSLEDRQATIQTERRKALLSATLDMPDALGRYKRRDSGTNFTYDETDEAALVYMHRITKDDTLAGVMLKYACQPEVFRKVNRFWPNDNIQTRTHVFLPVDACSVKSTKVDDLHCQDLLGASFDQLDDTTKDQAGSSQTLRDSKITINDPVASPTMSALSLTNTISDQENLKHDSWVLLPNFPNPVEILRMPRKSLGYFPRARRKSNATLTDTSTASTPKTSFNMLRHPPTHAAQVAMSLNASPVRRPTLQLRQDSGRQRSSSTATTTQGQQPSFTEALRGPGGVGSLRGLRTEPSRPGPADDALNQKFRQYFPDLGNAILAPPQDFPVARLGGVSGLLRATPRASMDSVRSQRSNSSGIGDVGGALEGWVRKLASKKERAGAERVKMGDLIELETNSEMGEGVLGDDDEEDLLTPKVGSMGGRLDTGGRKGESQMEEEELLDERFPVRGRVMNAYGSGKDKGG